MIVATLYKFSKKANSTAQPSLASTPSLSVQIRLNDGDSSLLSPSIRLTPPRINNTEVAIYDYNYIHIPQFSRYYYVDNWDYNGDGTWSAICSVDTLASWKAAIQASPGYVGRSQSYRNSSAMDTIYPALDSPLTIRNTANTGFSPAISSGTIVLGIANAQPVPAAVNQLGGVRYYMMSANMFLTLVQKLIGFQDDDGNLLENILWKLTDTAENMVQGYKSLNTPLQYVTSCRFYPVTFNTSYQSNIINLMFGGWKTTAIGALLPQLYEEFPWNSQQGYHWGELQITDASEIPIPGTNPQQYLDGTRYPAYAPYADYSLITPWGNFTLEANVMADMMRWSADSRKLYWKISLNIADGMGTFVVRNSYALTINDNNGSATVSPNTIHEFLRTQIKLGVDIPLMGTYEDIIYTMSKGSEFVSSLGQTAGSAMSLGEGGGVGGFISGVGNMAFGLGNLLHGAPKYADGSTGFSGNMTTTVNTITLQQTRYQTVAQAPQLYGYPLKEYVNNLTDRPFAGYVQFDVTNFTANCTATERERIRQQLVDGIYIE